MGKLIGFLRSLADEERIPLQNRVVLGGLLAYLLTPIDIIPDFIPILGWLDDAFVTILIMDYVFDSADTDIILEHYPWSKAHFARMRVYSGRLSWMIPATVRRILFREAKRYALSSKQHAEVGE